MKQDIANTIPDLLSQAGVINLGITAHEETIPLVLNTSLAFAADLNPLVVARDNHEQGKLTLAEKFALVDSIMTVSRNDLTVGRDVLKKHFGYSYSQKYAAIGLNKGTIAVPRSIEGVQSTLGAYKGFFEANPTLENAALDVTAAHYGALSTQLLAARGVVNEQKKEVEDLAALRDAKAAKLRKRIRWVINELNQNVDPLSSIWTAFGLNKPGATSSPEKVEGVLALLIGPNAAALKWEAAARATHYRVWKRVQGVDQQFVSVGSPGDVDFTLEGLPSNATIEIAITAVNASGESAFSTVITLVTH